MRFFLLTAFAVLTLHVATAQVTATRTVLLTEDVPYLSTTARGIGFMSRERNSILLKRDADQERNNPGEPEYFVTVPVGENGALTEATVLAEGERRYSDIAENYDVPRYKEDFAGSAVKSLETVNKNSLFYIGFKFKKMYYGLMKGKSKDIDLAENPFGAPDVGFPTGLGGATTQLTDPVSGSVVIAGDIKYKKDKSKKNSVHHEHRIITFTYDGELVNNVVYDTEEPYRVRDILPIHADYLIGKEGKYDHVAVLLAGSKPKGEEQTDFRKFKLVVIEVKTGKVTAEDDVDLGIRLPKRIKRFSPAPGITSHLMIGNYENDPAIVFLTISKDGLVEVKTFHEGSEEYKLLLNRENAHHEGVGYTHLQHSATKDGGTIYLGKFAAGTSENDLTGGIAKKMAPLQRTTAASTTRTTRAPKTTRGAASAPAAPKEEGLGYNILSFSPDGKLQRINFIPARDYKLLSDDDGELKLFNRKGNVAQIHTISAEGEVTETKMPEGEFKFLRFGSEFYLPGKRKLYLFGQPATDSGLDVITISY